MPTHPTIAESALPPGGVAATTVEGRAICIVRAPDGQVYALDDRCSHEAASLSEGDLLGFEIECPLHFSRFDVRTGEPVRPPALDAVERFRVIVKGGMIHVEL